MNKDYIKYIYYFRCRLCGVVFEKDDMCMREHLKTTHNINVIGYLDEWVKEDVPPKYECEICGEILKRTYHKKEHVRCKHPNYLIDIDIIKPWTDHESLFCDTNFLESLLNKKVTKGTECKGIV